MTRLTAKMVKDAALAAGWDLVGIANIERFRNAPTRMNPVEIMPEAKSVIVGARRIVRGNWRGIEEGTYWPTYTYFGYSGLLNTWFLPKATYETACFIENFGYEAVPYYAGVPECQPPAEPLRPGAVAPDVEFSIRVLGIAAGLGEIGWSKVFLTKKFGPRVRLGAIVTDAELEPDPLVEPGTLCDRCMACVEGCPCGAIPHLRDHKTVKVQIEDKTYEWADVHMGKCTLTYHGGDARVSPFIHKSWPGFNYDVREQDVSEETAYRIFWTLDFAPWRRTDEDPSGHVIEGHAMLAKWGAGGMGVEGSRGCMRSCFNHLEKRGTIEQTFEGGEFIKRPRWLLPCRVASRRTTTEPGGGEDQERV